MRRGRRLIYTQDYLRLKGTLVMGSVVLAKGHPERKGVVERTNGYLETLPSPRGSTPRWNALLAVRAAERPYPSGCQ